MYASNREEFSEIEDRFFQTGVQMEEASLAETDALIDAADGPPERRRRQTMSIPGRLAVLGTVAAAVAVMVGLFR